MDSSQVQRRIRCGLEGVKELQNEKSKVPSSAESRGVAHLLMGAGVVLVRKFYGNRPAPPRLREFWWLRNFFFHRASTPPLLRRGLRTLLFSFANTFTLSMTAPASEAFKTGEAREMRREADERQVRNLELQ